VTLSAENAEKEFVIEIPYRAASDEQYLMLRYTISGAISDGEISLKGIVLEKGSGNYSSSMKH
jgi:hypothetical protein